MLSKKTTSRTVQKAKKGAVKKPRKKRPKATWPLESVEQCDFLKWFTMAHRGVLIYAIPNGGTRNPREAARLKKEGVLPGMPDLAVPEFRLWVEMKRQKESYATAIQKQRHEELRAIGDTVLIGYGWRDAREKVQEFLRLRDADKRT